MRRSDQFKRLKWVVALAATVWLLNYSIAPAVIGYGDGYGAGLARLEKYCRPHIEARFNAEAWRLAAIGPPPATNSFYGRRYEMVDYLLVKRVTNGTTEQQLLTLLGKPDSVLNSQSFKAVKHGRSLVTDKIGKDILDNQGQIAYWSYYLASQKQYRSKSLWYPGRSENSGQWTLIVRLRNGYVSMAEVSIAER